MPNVGQISTFGLACTGRIDTKATSFTSIPQKLAMPFLPYKTMKQLQRQISSDRNHASSSSLYRKQKTGEIKIPQTNLQVVGIYAGGHQIFIRISSRVCFLIWFYDEIEENFYLRHNVQMIIELYIIIVHFLN